MWAFSIDYDMQRIVPPFYHPMNQFRPMWRYFWNDWIWGQTWEHLTVQLDLPILFMIGVGVLGLIFSLFKKPVGRHDPRLPKLVPILPFIIMFTIVLMLQDSFRLFLQIFPWSSIPPVSLAATRSPDTCDDRHGIVFVGKCFSSCSIEES